MISYPSFVLRSLNSENSPPEAPVPLNEAFALDFQGEAGLHMAGGGESFESLTTGFSWLPERDFRVTFRYELRDAGGVGQAVSANVVGQATRDITLLARLASTSASQRGQEDGALSFMGGAALRPRGHDRVGLFLYWSRQDQRQDVPGRDDVRTRTDTVSADSIFQVSPRIRYFLKAALAFSEDKPDGLPGVTTTTTLVQNRLEYRIGRRWDVTGEFRSVYLWQGHLSRVHLATEGGFWLNSGMRIGLGYAVALSRALAGEPAVTGGGFYLNLTSSANPILDLLRGAL